jgi:hypothetical protein
MIRFHNVFMYSYKIVLHCKIILNTSTKSQLLSYNKQTYCQFENKILIGSKNQKNLLKPDMHNNTVFLFNHMKFYCIGCISKIQSCLSTTKK